MGINKERACVYVLPTVALIRRLRITIETTARQNPTFGQFISASSETITDALYETVFVVTHNHLLSFTNDPSVPLLSEEDAVRRWCPAYYSSLKVADLNSETGTSPDELSEFIYERFIDDIVCSLSYTFSFLPGVHAYSMFELEETRDGIIVYYAGDWRAREWSEMKGLPYEFCESPIR